MPIRFMTTLVVVASLLLVSGQALAQAQLPAFRSGDVLRADQLNRIVEQVRRNADAAGGSGGGATHTVDCNAGETLQSKLDAAQPGDTIEITGTCNEAVVVNKDDITLDGQGSAVIDGAGIDRWAVDVTGRQKVTIEGLTVLNGHAVGIHITESSGVWMQDVTVRNTRRHKDYQADGHGIFVGHASSVVLTGTIVADNNAGNGITVWQSGNALAIGNFTPRGNPFPMASVQTNGNGEQGIFVGGSSSFAAFSNFGENTTVHANENTYSGISVQQSSSVMIGGADIEATKNGFRGFDVGGASAAQFWGNAPNSKTASGLFDSNGESGIAVWRSSSLGVWDDGVAVNITSTNNMGAGLYIVEGSGVGFNSPPSTPSKLVFNNNGWDGISIDNSGALFSQIPSEMKDNAYEGVDAYAGGHFILNDATITGNTGHGVEVIINSSGAIIRCRIEDNGGDGIHVSQNATVNIQDTTITSNDGQGIGAYTHAFVQAYEDVGSSITANGMHGVNAWNGAIIEIHNATITGNTNGDVNASFGSRIRFPGSTIGGISCDDSVLSQGDWVCPDNDDE